MDMSFHNCLHFFRNNVAIGGGFMTLYGCIKMASM